MTVPATMRAVTAPRPGGPEALVVGEHPVPLPGPGQLLVEVAAAGVNRPDCLQRAGSYPPPPGAGPILGLEVAGTVVRAGEGTTRFAVGDALCALVVAGGYAEYVAVDEGSALALPPTLSPVEAAAVPENYFTVWSNVFDRGRLTAGEWFLVHGGTSGIGTTAIQLAKVFGAKVIATAGSAKKCAAMVELGVDRAVDYNAEDFVAACKEAAPGGVDLVLDMVGGDYVERNWAVAAVEGRIVQIATLNGVSKANFGLLMRKRLVHTGSTLRPREKAFKAALARTLEVEVWPLFAAGRVKVVMDRTFPLDQVAESHRRMESGRHIGKIVLTL